MRNIWTGRPDDGTIGDRDGGSVGMNGAGDDEMCNNEAMQCTQKCAKPNKAEEKPIVSGAGSGTPRKIQITEEQARTCKSEPDEHAASLIVSLTIAMRYATGSIGPGAFETQVPTRAGISHGDGREKYNERHGVVFTCAASTARTPGANDGIEERRACESAYVYRPRQRPPRIGSAADDSSHGCE